MNYTKGNLAATAYRTRASDDWNFKYYRYDVRGRVIKMWNIISGFDTLITDYFYNSQDQVTDSDPDYTNITEYDYNPNSQVSKQKFNDNNIENVYSYNNRNWIASMINSQTIFDFANSYFRNGNVKSTELSGDYNKNFASSSTLNFDYSYDKSNRLTETSNTSKYFELVNTYDKDGNILTLDRNGSTGNLIDDFNYAYYSGTNKLQRVTGSGTQYTYDANGNMTSDAINRNTNITYNHRNLILELRHTKYILNDSLIILTKYYYDETGNRIRKMSYNTGNDSLINDVVYSRDISGRELAIYENGSIEQWNTYGMDNTGFIDGNDDIRYYMKDHLGSVRAVTDGSGSVISSQDYDAWGYLLEDRVYGSDESVYKFTGKERDDESEYDYFGARYYDARVGRWGQVEPLLDKYISWSPYQYSFVNPIKMKDVNGKDAKVTIEGTKITIDVKIFFSMDNVSSSGTFKDEYSQNLFSNYLQEAQNQWQDAFSQVSRYDIEFNIIPEFVSIEELNDINSKLQTGELNSGENVADYKDEKEPGVNLNYLRIVPMEGKSSPPYTGSHEIGHLIGFEHPYKKTSSMQKKSKNIMGYSHDRDMPTKYDALRFLNKLDLSKNIQIIKGAKDAN